MNRFITDSEGLADAVECLNFVTNSLTRMQIVLLLAEKGRMNRGELRDHSNVSRTTLQRNLKVLRKRGWIQHENRTHRLTTKGRTIIEDLQNVFQTAATMNRLEAFVAAVPAESLDFDLRLLADASITIADKGNPYAPVNEHIRVIRSADRFRAVLPSVGLQPMEVARESVHRGSEHEIIIGPRAATTVGADSIYQDPVTDLVGAENCSLLVTDLRPPFYLGLADDIVQIGAEENGQPHALVETTTPEIRSWAEETFNKYKQQSEQFTQEVVV